MLPLCHRQYLFNQIEKLKSKTNTNANQNPNQNQRKEINKNDEEHELLRKIITSSGYYSLGLRIKANL